MFVSVFVLSIFVCHYHYNYMYIFIRLYTTLSLKACKINNASGTSAESKKVREVFNGGEVLHA